MSGTFICFAIMICVMAVMMIAMCGLIAYARELERKLYDMQPLDPVIADVVEVDEQEVY